MLKRVFSTVLIPAACLIGCGGDTTAPTGGGGGAPPPPPPPPPPPAQATTIAKLSGDAQIIVTGATLTAPLVVRVTDAQGVGISGISVTWGVAAGGGSVSATSTTTNGSGQASVSLTVGSAGGPNTVTASSTGLAGSPVTFTATGRTPATFAVVSGDNQNGKTVEQLPNPFVVAVEDPQGLPVPGVSVSWAVTGGGGILSASSSQTDAQGRTSVNYIPGPALGVNTVTASAAGPAPIIFTSQTTVMLIRLQGIAFVDPTGGQNSQAAVTIAVGDTIEWVNLDNVTHTITSTMEPAGGVAFDSGIVGNGVRFRFVPAVTGAWIYFCQLHPGTMLGATITVQ